MLLLVLKVPGSLILQTNAYDLFKGHHLRELIDSYDCTVHDIGFFSILHWLVLKSFVDVLDVKMIENSVHSTLCNIRQRSMTLGKYHVQNTSE